MKKLFDFISKMMGSAAGIAVFLITMAIIIFILYLAYQNMGYFFDRLTPPKMV